MVDGPTICAGEGSRCGTGCWGGLAVTEGHRPLELGGRKQRAVLAVLLLDAGRPVSVDRLIDAVWGDHPPQQAEASLQTYVSNLRRLLEPGRGPRQDPSVLITRPAGYVLAVDRAAVDLTRFEDLVEEGRARRRAGNAAAAAAGLRDALALWAPVLPEFAGEPFLREAEARLAALHGLALEESFDARLELEDHDAAVADLEAAVLRHPVRERLWAQLALALYRAGRQTDALRALQRARGVLTDEVGVEPGPELRRLEADILDHAARLQPRPVAAPAPPVPAATPAGAAEPFVGRDGELDTLLAVAGAAAGGHGRVAVVSGEPGIGKTRLVEEVASRSRAAGTVVAWARCPESAASAAFWPMTQLADQLVAAGALAPENRPDLPAGDPDGAVPADPAADRFAVHAAAVGAIASVTRPCVLVVDDLQWADAASLRLLEFAAGELRSLPVALIVTTRAPDDTSPAALVDCLGELARQPGAVRIDLGGLSQDAVTRWLGARSIDDMSAFVHDRSGGNPFFVRELVELLVSEGGASVAVPAAVADVVRRRVGRLPPLTQRLLSMASVVGRTVDVDILARVAELPMAEALEGLDPAVAAGLLAEDPSALGRFRFSHALVAEALVTELAASRRARLHAATALAIDALRPAGEGQLVELSHHATAGAVAGTAELAVESSARAARHAAARTAHEDAARHWATALRAVDLARPGDRRARYEILVELGLARRRADDVAGAQEALLDAIRVADDLDDVDAMARAACAVTQEGFWQVGDYLTPDPALADGVARVLDRLGPADSAARAELLGILANVLHFSAEPRRLDELSAEAVTVARRVGDPEVLARSLIRRIGAIWRAPTIAERRALAEELATVAEAHDLPAWIVFCGAFARMFTAFEQGEPAEGHLARVRALAEASGSPAARTQLGWFEAGWLGQRGEYAAAERVAWASYELYRRTRRWAAEVILGGAMLLVWVDRGRFPEGVGIDIGAVLESTYSLIARESVAWALLESGMNDEARAVIGPPGGVPEPPDDWAWLATLAGAALVRAELGDVEAVGRLYPQLLPYSGLVVMSGSVPSFGVVDWALACCAEALGQEDAAAGHAAGAVDLARRIGARALLSRTLVVHGRVLAGSGDTERAAQAFAEARALAAELGVVPVLRRLDGLSGS
ncbi:MAG TPA: BTAD domain-containing putative transcriptional regulator [Acidimicrobiales bacterium]|nr:BTAD domain-containing putative transcriptional regulator [Acidimicrobiales bacterium]